MCRTATLAGRAARAGLSIVRSFAGNTEASSPHGREPRSAQSEQFLHYRSDRQVIGFATNDIRPASRHFVYFASIQASDPVSLTATPEIKMCSGLPSAVPRCSVEISRGPAFL